MNKQADAVISHFDNIRLLNQISAEMKVATDLKLHIPQDAFLKLHVIAMDICNSWDHVVKVCLVK